MCNVPIWTWSAHQLHGAKRGLAEVNFSSSVAAHQHRHHNWDAVGYRFHFAHDSVSSELLERIRLNWNCYCSSSANRPSHHSTLNYQLLVAPKPSEGGSATKINSQPLPFGHSPLLCSSPINPVLPDIERRYPRAVDPEYHSQIRFDDSRINRVFRSRR